MESNGQAEQANQEQQQADQQLPQSKVDELVAGAKQKGKQQAQEELEQLRKEKEQLQKTYEEAKQQAGTMGGMQQQPDMEKIRNQVYQDIWQDFEKQQSEYQQEQQQEEAKRIAAEYDKRMKQGPEQFEDFEDVVKGFDPQSFPNIVMLATQMDNTPGIIYELAKNPNKLATMSHLAERSPQVAQNAMQKLNESIQANTQAQQQAQQVSEPLSRLQSSPKAQDTGSPNSVADFKKLFRG